MIEIIKLTDREGDVLHIEDSEDYLCYISVNDGSNFGLTPSNAYKIIDALKDLLENPS